MITCNKWKCFHLILKLEIDDRVGKICFNQSQIPDQSNKIDDNAYFVYSLLIPIVCMRYYR